MAKVLKENEQNPISLKVNGLEAYLRRNQITISPQGGNLLLTVGKTEFIVQGDELPRMFDEEKLVLAGE